MAELGIAREAELGRITDDLAVLVDRERLLRDTIIEFTGPRGMGKTTMVDYVARMCIQRNINYIPHGEAVIRDELPYVREQLAQGPLVLSMELDGLKDSQLQVVGENLNEMYEQGLNGTNMLVVMTGATHRVFKQRSIDRRLRTSPLKPLEAQACSAFLGAYDPALSSQVHQAIIEWTGGYPLGLRTMADIVADTGLDPTKETDGAPLLSMLTEKVVDKALLVGARSDEERTRHHTLLSLLSVPRRFNLLLARDLIEKFTPDYQLYNLLAYTIIPRDIDKVAPGALYWDAQRSGYHVHDALRPVLSLGYRIASPAAYEEVHGFLAAWNRSAAQELTASNASAIYLQEATYHEEQLRTV